MSALFRIAYDAKRYFQNQTGLGNYSRWLIDGMDQNLDFEISLFTPKAPSNIAEGRTKIVSPSSFISKILPWFWRSFSCTSWLKNNNYDVYHGLSNELPFGIHRFKNLLKIVTIHDVINLRFPEQYPWFDRYIYKLKLKYAIKYADVIITPSEFTKNEVLHFFKVESKKIEVIGLNREVSNKVTDYSLCPKKPYFACISGFSQRKNVKNLVLAFELIKNDIDLVIAGKKSDTYDEILALTSDKSRIHIHSNPSDEQIKGLQEKCMACVYPSFFEGFGIPILEAFNAQKTIATSNESSLPEVGGNAAVYFDPYDVNDIAEKLIFLTVEENRKKLEGNIPAQQSRFSSEVLLDSYRKIYSRPK